MSWHHVFSAREAVAASGPLIPELTALFDPDHVCSSGSGCLWGFPRFLKQFSTRAWKSTPLPGPKAPKILSTVGGFKASAGAPQSSLCAGPDLTPLKHLSRAHWAPTSMAGRALDALARARRGDMKEGRSASSIPDGRGSAMAGPGPWAGSGAGPSLAHTESPWPTSRRSWAS